MSSDPNTNAKEVAPTPNPTIGFAIAALTIGAIAMGFSPVFVREAEIGAFASAFWRVLFALPVLLVWALIEARKPLFSVNRAVILAGMFFAGDLVFWHLAILNTTMANATFLVGFAPVWVLLLARFWIGEPASGNELSGSVVCIVGMGLLIGSSFSFEPQRLIGDFYGVITSIFLGLYFLAMRSARKQFASGQLFFASTSITMIILWVIALLSGDKMFPSTTTGWASLVSLGVFTHAGGQGLVTIALGTLSAMFSSLVIFMEALAAALFGWLLYDETLDLLQSAGCGLIAAGIWIARPYRNRAD